MDMECILYLPHIPFHGARKPDPMKQTVDEFLAKHQRYAGATGKVTIARGTSEADQALVEDAAVNAAAVILMRETLEKIIPILNEHSTYSDNEGESHNDNDVIAGVGLIYGTLAVVQDIIGE